MSPEVEAFLAKGQKQKKFWRTILIVLAAVVAVFAVVAAILFVMAERDKESPAMAQEFLQAVVQEDSGRAYALMYPGLQSEEDFAAGFEEICALWKTYGGGADFQLKRTGWHLEAERGVRQYTVEYEVTSGETLFRFRLLRAEQENLSGMVGANLSIDALPEGK